jgi:hypothetical protein
MPIVDADGTTGGWGVATAPVAAPRLCVGAPSSEKPRTSSLVTRPCGPVGGTRLRSTLRSRAILRVAGVASGFSLK